MNQIKYDKFWIGAVLGILGALLGFFGFGLIWAAYNDATLGYFIREIFIGSGLFQDKIVTVSILLDVVFFYIFMKMGWFNLCKGILAIVILSVPVAAWLY